MREAIPKSLGYLNPLLFSLKTHTRPQNSCVWRRMKILICGRSTAAAVSQKPGSHGPQTARPFDLLLTVFIAVQRTCHSPHFWHLLNGLLAILSNKQTNKPSSIHHLWSFSSSFFLKGSLWEGHKRVIIKGPTCPYLNARLSDNS
jgi:hypothetical protein